MRTLLKNTVLLLTLAALPLTAFGVDPQRRIRVYAIPYYQAANSADAQPAVSVGRDIDELLTSNKPEDIRAAEQWIRKNPQMVTPMALMVLAIRLYDTDQRDSSVFWFYAAKDRYATMIEVLEADSPTLARADKAMRPMVAAAGAAIEGYAYCDIAKQQKLRRDGFEWVQKNTYQVLFLRQLPARPGKRQANLKLALTKIGQQVDEAQRYMGKFENYHQLQNTRRQDLSDEKYCWK
jgi:hypothetical protein